jgi:hypothetical protein
VGFLIAAVGVAIHAAGQKPRLIASTAGPVLTLPDTRADALVLYGDLPDGSATSGLLLCRLKTSGPASADYRTRLRSYDVDGRVLHETGTVDEGWAPGDTVTCPGVAHLAAVAGTGPLPLLAFSGVLLLVGLGSGGLAVVGRRSAAARRL